MGVLRQNLALIGLGLRLTRAGGVARWLTIFIGSALVSALLLAAYALPAALTAPEVVIPADERIKRLQLVILFAIPVLALLFTVLRLSSSTRDRRLAGLRLLGLSPRATRVVAVTEGSATALLGALLGSGVFVVFAKAADARAWGSQWLKQPLEIAVRPIAIVVLLVVGIAIVVALASTRALKKDPRSARSEAATKPLSWWRVAPLLVGLAILAWVLIQDQEKALAEQGHPPDWWTLVMFVGWVVVGLSIPLVVPLFSGWAAQKLGDQNRWLAGRLAGRRLAVEPASATRSVTGLALATYSSIIVLLFIMVVTQGSEKFVEQQSYLEQGPQPITLKVMDASKADLISQEDIESLAVVQRVTPRFHASLQHEVTLASSDPADPGGRNELDGNECGPDTGQYPCLPVFIGSCEDFAHTRGITDCGEGTVQFSTSKWHRQESIIGAPKHVTLAGKNGTIELPVSETEILVADEDWSDQQILVPLNYPGVAEVLGEPRAYAITADGGRDAQLELTQFAQQNGMEAKLPPSGTYEKTMLARAGLMALIASIIGIGLLTVAVGTVDRTVERRRAVASLVVIGVPVTTLRMSQIIQVIIPMAISVVLAVLTGLFSARVFFVLLRNDGLWANGSIDLTYDIMRIAIPLGIACIAVALATLPGLGEKLRPETLRRD